MTDLTTGGFAHLLRSHRRDRRLTQERLAELAGVSARSIREMERGRGPRPKTAERLADALRLPPAQRPAFLGAARAAFTAGKAATTAKAQPAAQLPADLPHFVAREAELASLDELLADGGPAVAAVVGPAGSGKTALAVRWAHLARQRFPHGQCYVDLRGFDPAGTPAQPHTVIREILTALGVGGARIPATSDAQLSLYRTLLARRPMLIVLDNARDAGQVRPLLPGDPASRVVVTSRDRLTGLVVADGAKLVSLPLLTEREGQRLLAGRIGEHRAAAEPGPLRRIAAHCGGLPLALAIASAWAVGNPGFPLAALETELAEARPGLEPFTGPDPATDIRSVFSWTYRTLSPAAARLFRLLSLHPSHDFGLPAAASAAATGVAEARRLLAELTQAHLLQEPAPGRYAFHDLLRAYAAETAEAEPVAERDAALRRVIDHYRLSAWQADRRLNPGRDPIPRHPAAPGVTPATPPATADAAAAWLARESATLLRIVELAAAHDRYPEVVELAWAMATDLDRRAGAHDQIAVQQAALAAAATLGDTAGHAVAQRLLARAHLKAGRYDDARHHFEQSLLTHLRLGDLPGQATIHLGLGHVHERHGDPAAALREAERAMHLYERAEHQAGIGMAGNVVGWCHALLGDYDKAIRHCAEALAVATRLGNPQAQAAAWDSIAYAHHHLAEYDRALICHQEALQLYRSIGDHYNEAEVLDHLGDTHHAAGSPTQARRHWQRAAARFDRAGHPQATTVRAKLKSLPR